MACIVFPMTEVKVDSSGKVILPKALREASGLSAGTVADAVVTPEGLMLRAKGRSKREDTFLGYVLEARSRDRGRKLTREQVLEACENALEGLEA